MRYWMPLFAVLSLAGCKTIQDAQDARDDERCLTYGVAKGSPGYVDCRTNLQRGRDIRRAAILASD